MFNVRQWWRRRWAARTLPEGLSNSLQTVSQRLSAAGIDHALIGGLAVSLHGPPRATRDIDFLIDGGQAERAEAVMNALGFETLQRKAIFANYVLDLLRVDFLHTQGELSVAMLSEAVRFQFESGKLKVARPEDLIGLKLQALSNNPSRGRDRIDIDSLVRQFKATMNMVLVRQYFVLFNMEHELDEILNSYARGGR